MNDLETFPSLQRFGEQLDELADGDATRARRFTIPRLARPGIPGRLAPVVRFAAALGVMTALIAGTYAVPTTRAAVGDLYDSTLAHWFSGEEPTPPGRPAVAGEDLPDWLASEQALHGEGDARVLAEADGDELVALRQGERISLGVAGFSQTTSVDELRKELSGQRIRLLAPGKFVPNGRHDLRPIFGLVSASLTRIQLNYADGTIPASQDHLNGAFGFTIQTNRRASSLTGYDAAGRLIARKPFIADPRDATAVNDQVGDFRYCPDVAGCLPWPAP
jgi:hypothetical protein